jgi:hypothetical protein
MHTKFQLELLRLCDHLKDVSILVDDNFTSNLSSFLGVPCDRSVRVFSSKATSTQSSI